MQTFITVKTKSNYKNCNFAKSITVSKFLGPIVECVIPMEGYTKNGEYVSEELTTTTFAVIEITSIIQK